MNELDYNKIFLVGKAKDGGCVFLKIDTENFKLNYIKTKSFVVDFTQLKTDISKLEKSEIIDILFLATDGMETAILDGTTQGDIIISKIYKDFLIYDIEDVKCKEIEIYIKSYENFEIIEYFQKDRLDRVLKYCKEKDNYNLQNELDWNSIFDDLSDYKKGKNITKVENEINSKENLFKLFCEFLESQNIKLL
ncbi:MAG TPA: hypothetical protein PKK56_02505 [archaeon]|nr:hypothetical protein [archaeon]